MGIYDRLASICYENVVVASNLPKIEANIHLHDFFRVFSFNFGASIENESVRKVAKIGRENHAKWQQQRQQSRAAAAAA